MLTRKERLTWGGSSMMAALGLLVASTQVGPKGSWVWGAVVGGAIVAFLIGGGLFITAIPLSQIRKRYRLRHPEFVIHPGTARRLPLNDEGMGTIEMTGLWLEYKSSVPLTLQIQIVNYTPRGHWGVGTYHASGPETVKVRRGETYLPPLRYETGPFSDEAPYLNGRAKVWFTTPGHGRCWTIPLFETRPPKLVRGVVSERVFAPAKVAKWETEAKQFREDAGLVWQTLKAWYESPDFIQRLVFLAPWPDIRERRGEDWQAAQTELHMLCERACGKGAEFVPVNNARGRMDAVVGQWLQRIREVDGFVCWLRGRKALDWSVRPANTEPTNHDPYHGRTLKLIWYLGLAVAKDAGNRNPDYGAFGPFREAMDGEDFTP